MTRARVTAIGLSAAATLTLIACGNGVPQQPGGSGGGGGSSVGTAGAKLGTADVKVDATDQLQFSPNSSSAKVGQIIQWTNAGSVLHNVTFDVSSLSDSGLAPGGTWEVKFTKAGSYHYVCTFHAGMEGTVTVS